MCRNIKTLFNFEPPATEDEIQASALQFVRKLSGFNKPSQANAEAFDRALPGRGQFTPVERLAQFFHQRVVAAFDATQAAGIGVRSSLQAVLLSSEIIREPEITGLGGSTVVVS